MFAAEAKCHSDVSIQHVHGHGANYMSVADDGNMLRDDLIHLHVFGSAVQLGDDTHFN